MSRVISGITIVIAHMRGLTTNHGPPSRLSKQMIGFEASVTNLWVPLGSALSIILGT